MKLTWLVLLIVLVCATDVSAAFSWRTPNSINYYSSQDGTNTAAKSIDNNTGTAWDGGGEVLSPGGYEWGIRYNLSGANFTVNKIRIYSCNTAQARSPCRIGIVKFCARSDCTGASDRISSFDFNDGCKWYEINITEGTAKYIQLEGGMYTYSIYECDRQCRNTGRFYVQCGQGASAYNPMDGFYEFQYYGELVVTKPKINATSLGAKAAYQNSVVVVNLRNVTKGDDTMSKVWITYNNTVYGLRSAKSGDNQFNFSTDGLMGNYTIKGWVNDSGGRSNSTTIGTVKINMQGSANFVLSGSGGISSAGSSVAVISNNGSVLANDTVLSDGSNVSTGVVVNYRDVRVKIKLPDDNSLVFNKMNLSVINKTLTVVFVNLSSKPSYMDAVSNAIASNASEGSATISIKVNSEPNRICRCGNWSFISSSCSGSWVCESAGGYQRKYASGVFSFNVSHFSAYVVGDAGYNLAIWDDTNDVEGQNIPHYPGQSVGFFANYTNSSDDPILTGYCQIKTIGGFTNMTYNATSKLYYNYSSFGSSGTAFFNVTCKNGVNLSAMDDYYITLPPASGTTWSQVFWYTAENIAHSILYGVYNTTIPCTQTSLFYVEPPPINGIEEKVNASTDQTGQYFCQNDTQGVFAINNDGSVGLNISMVFDQISVGIRPKVGYAAGGWESVCSGTCSTSSCDLSTTCILLGTSEKQVIYNLGQNSSREIWLWTDFKGVSGTSAPTKGNLTTNATKA